MDTVVWQASALLLSYPDQRFYDRRPMLRAAVAELPAGPPAGRLTAFLDYVDATPPVSLMAEYMGVLRRCGLRLSEGAGAAPLIRLAEMYRAAGCETGLHEAPDSLPAMLEYAALCADDWLLVEHRHGLEALRRALAGYPTPYANPVEAVCATLSSGPRPAGRAEVVLAGVSQATFSPLPVLAPDLRDPLDEFAAFDGSALPLPEPAEFGESDELDEPDEPDEPADSEPAEEPASPDLSEPLAAAAAGLLPEARLSVR